MRTSGVRGTYGAFLLALLCAVWPAHAQDEPVVTKLQFLEEGFSLNLLVTTNREVVFKKEPDFAGHKVDYGAILLDESSMNYIGYAWDSKGGKLYLDLNENLDLTDDPSGIYEARSNSPFGAYSKLVKGIRLDREEGGITRSYIVDGEFYEWGYAAFTVRSGWRGEVKLGDQSYSFGIADNLDGVIGKGDQFLFQDEDLHDAPSTLVLDEGLYGLSYGFEPGDNETALAMSVQDATPELGKLDLEGTDIERFVASGSCLALLENPGGNLELPVGRYDGAFVRFKGGCMALHDMPLHVRIDGTKTLRLGGPLKPTLKVVKSGSRLHLSYELLNGFGQECVPPEGHKAGFTIYQDGRPLLSRDFEYG